MKANLLTLIICTRNRSFILPECLDSLIHQTIAPERFHIIVVDNGSADNTREIVARYPNIHYIFEPDIGLSIARNTGYQAATTEWIGYIDDDAKSRPNLVERALQIIHQFQFDAFGGMFYPWYKYGKPKWLPEGFGKKEQLRKDPGAIKEDQFLSGGIFFVRKVVLKERGAFASELGMRAGIGYGEENELQIRMRKAGYTIGFDPELAIDHCVMPYKLHLRWHLQAAYARGRDREWIERKFNFITSLFGLCRSLFGVFYKGIKRSYRLVTNNDYYWQNFVLDSFYPVMIWFGVIKACLLRSNFSRKKL